MGRWIEKSSEPSTDSIDTVDTLSPRSLLSNTDNVDRLDNKVFLFRQTLSPSLIPHVLTVVQGSGGSYPVNPGAADSVSQICHLPPRR